MDYEQVSKYILPVLWIIIVACLVIKIRKDFIESYITKESKAYDFVRNLNKRIGFNHVEDDYINVELNSLQRYRSYDAKSDANKFIQNNFDKVKTKIDYIIENRNCYAVYKKQLAITPESTKADFPGIISFSTWKKREKKMIDSMIKSPKLDYKIVVNISYTSPGGRNEYKRDAEFPFEYINEIIQNEEMEQNEEWIDPVNFKRHQGLKGMSGCYIFHNLDKDEYYVGQATNLYGRVLQHLQGRGNGDLYADYRYGDRFKIKIVPLDYSAFDNLNEEEKYFISFYNSYNRGYNRTIGND